MKTLKIVIATDSFKGSATSLEIENYIETGIKRVVKNAEIIKIPIADGGEGTVDAINYASGGEIFKTVVTGPYNKKVNAKYLIIKKKIAIIEMASASGLTLADNKNLNPFIATTYGTGELINAVLKHQDVEEIYVGLGGSATNDGGVGLAQALGVSFLDENQQEIGLGAQDLGKIKVIDASNLNRRVKKVKFHILSDVTNPLCGKNGASFVFGAQKGASAEEIIKLDELLLHYGTKLNEMTGIDIINHDGAGAAGGLGAAMIAFTNATMHRGISKILELTEINKHLKDADLVITGEGRMDEQSLFGKTPLGIAELAKKYNLPVIAIVGSTKGDLSKTYKNGIDLIIDIINEPMELEFAMKNVQNLAENAAETAIRAYLLHK